MATKRLPLPEVTEFEPDLRNPNVTRYPRHRVRGYKRSGLTAGPTVDQVFDAITDPANKTVLRAFPAMPLYSNWVQ